MYAVIRTGGKQYKVEQGQRLNVELLGQPVGDSVTFTPVLVVDGEKVVSDKAALANAKVSATIVAETKGPKVIGFMYKPKARARKRWGHRQRYATVEISAISA
jgi:large subunit ribosomal protein L21